MKEVIVYPYKTLLRKLDAYEGEYLDEYKGSDYLGISYDSFYRMFIINPAYNALYEKYYLDNSINPCCKVEDMKEHIRHLMDPKHDILREIAHDFSTLFDKEWKSKYIITKDEFARLFFEFQLTAPSNNGNE